MISYLTIGQLSKYSGIHTKALRYYEEINILKPTYINPKNGYRYYMFSTISYVKVIKICADYGIPLKNFTQFINESGDIHMTDIIKLAEKKIYEKEIQLVKDKLQINQYKQQIMRSDQLDHTINSHIDIGNEDFYIVPFKGDILSKEYYEAVQKTLSKLELQGFSFDQRLGLFYRIEENIWKSYLAFKIIECSTSYKKEEVICLNHSHIHAEHITEDEIHVKILNIKNKTNQIFLLETFEEPYNFNTPHLELLYIL
ncbi:transcriptional regulator [Streptococcus penaeicida]|uniref:Transcriptional regulator n=1 Tax=Streptococcus penaeicida TaxID=1765960 RepID=A0A2N8LAX1_9STRE|nr:MerR family DNA-binding transcriptional regulator [Streptococcus penaeicida]PND47300.1 transcriptional regulator [Streptococcus penaeicida]HEN2956782.1 MerR family DNA-binding transcriptional regulator [Streptococcus agalactiae]HEN3089755.1 MerR family DNA-binding transcriptional regulator [Streptococcus agalactiae]